MQKLQVRLRSALFQKSEGEEEGWKICVRTEDGKRLGLKVKQKVYIIQYDNCIPVFVQ